MEFIEHVRKPFTVDALQITEENLDELAPLIGEIREKPDGERYIEVDPDLIPNLVNVYVGFYLTRIGKNMRCYSQRIFTQQFTPNTDDIRKWIEYLNG